jgi:hypothetical protein
VRGGGADLEALIALQKLAQTDRKVRSHEQAHLAAAGPYARGGATYTFERGPDGRLYAVGGEVAIDTSPVAGDPEATLRKAQAIKASALAPADPSAQDRAVAAQAAQLAASAQAEIHSRQTSGSDARLDYEDLFAKGSYVDLLA